MSQARGFKVKFLSADGGAEMINIEFPNGDDVRRPATAQDREAYPAEYDAFRTGSTGPIGTDIAVLGIEETTAAAIRRQGFDSVELLAGVADSELRRLRDGYSLQRKARAYLAENQIPPGVKRELDKLQERIATVEKALAEREKEG